jgi:starch-binding outer membrane protein, SusD/RagB family
MKKTIIYISILCTGLAFTGCKKWLDVGPENVILQEDALKTPDDLQRLLVSCYDVMGNTFNGNVQNIAELLSDNVQQPLNNLEMTAVYDRETTFFNNTINNVYTDLYRSVYRCNTLLESFDLIEGLSTEDRLRIESEARFIRAINHWWALKLYAQPWGATADNSHLGIVIRSVASQEPLARSTVKEAYDFIIADLEYAFNNLPASNGAYANRYAAAALLAHVYFQQNNYNSAVAYSNEVINSGVYTMEPTLDYFRAMSPEALGTTNPEAIFSIVSINNSEIVDARNKGFRDNYWADVAGAQLSYSSDLNNFFNLTPSDGRISAWILSASGQVQALRFGSENMSSFFFNIPLLRMSVLKLIRAEALAELGSDLSTAIQDVNDIRARAFGAGINDLSSGSSANEIIAAARDEFRKETISEGLRIDQIRRLGALGENIEVRNAPWNCPGMAIQFPNSEFTGALFIGNPEGGCN